MTNLNAESIFFSQAYFFIFKFKHVKALFSMSVLLNGAVFFLFNSELRKKVHETGENGFRI